MPALLSQKKGANTMRYQLFQPGHRVRVMTYGPFRGLIGTIRIVDTIPGQVDPFCFYLIDLEGAQTKESVWFEYEEVESISAHESDYLISIWQGRNNLDGIDYLDLSYSFGPMPFPILDSLDTPLREFLNMAN